MNSPQDIETVAREQIEKYSALIRQRDSERNALRDITRPIVIFGPAMAFFTVSVVSNWYVGMAAGAAFAAAVIYDGHKSRNQYASTLQQLSELERSLNIYQ